MSGRGYYAPPAHAGLTGDTGNYVRYTGVTLHTTRVPVGVFGIYRAMLLVIATGSGVLSNRSTLVTRDGVLRGAASVGGGSIGDLVVHRVAAGFARHDLLGGLLSIGQAVVGTPLIPSLFRGRVFDPLEVVALRPRGGVGWTGRFGLGFRRRNGLEPVRRVDAARAKRGHRQVGLVGIGRELYARCSDVRSSNLARGCVDEHPCGVACFTRGVAH